MQKGPFLVAFHLISPILAKIPEAWVTLTIYHPLMCSINTVLDIYLPELRITNVTHLPKRLIILQRIS